MHLLAEQGDLGTRPVLAQIAHVDPAELHNTGRRRENTSRDRSQRGLPGTTRADQCNPFTWLESQ